MRTNDAACAVLMASLALAPAAARATCPPEQEIRAMLAAFDLAQTARTARFGFEAPVELIDRAAERPGQIVVARNGDVGQAALVTATAIDVMWMAINDEDHHGEGDYLPLEHSEVIAGSSRGQQRILFQYFKLAGISRWWVDEVGMSESLFEESEGLLWELTWEDRMSRASEYPLPALIENKGLSPITRTRGAWLLVPLGKRCTLVEYLVDSDPGGALGFTNRLAATTVIRNTLAGMVRFAAEHIPQPHPSANFVRPNGESIPRNGGQE